MEKYSIVEYLGLDTLADRFLVRRQDDDNNKTYVLSKMEIMDLTNTVVAYHEYIPLMKLSSNSVASYFDVFTSVEHRISGSFLNLISEHFPMGHLEHYLQQLRTEKKPLNPDLLEKWFAQILDGLMYLWSQNLVHRNLKPDSIYLRGENSEENCSLVLGDIIPASIGYDLRALSYTAPEIFESEEYSSQSDIFSFGCVLLDMITTEKLTDEETLQLRICARYDPSTLSETLQNTQKIHEAISSLIGRMILPNPQERLTETDLQRDDFVIESMHMIDSDQIKYPSERDTKWARDGLANGETVEYYVDYLKKHRNAESRIEHVLQLCSRSKMVDTLQLTMSFRKDIVPIIEHFGSNSVIVEISLDLLSRILDSEHAEYIMLPSMVGFVTKMLSVFENDPQVIRKIADVLTTMASRDAKLVADARITSDIVQILSKHDHDPEISAKCCTLLWLMASDPNNNNNSHPNQQITMSLLGALLNILQKHAYDGHLFTKVCFAFLPLIFQKSTVDHLVQFNLVRYFTIGLQQHVQNPNAIKAVLAVLSELFKLDERCVMRFLCSRSTDGELLDSMKILTEIFDHFKNRADIARGIITLLKSMSSYDDAIDEMISTKIDEHLLFEIKRFHSDSRDIAQACADVMRRIRERSLIA